MSPPTDAAARPPRFAADDGIDRHSTLEDLLALLVGSLLVALGVAMFKQAELLTGGTAGLAFLLHYATGGSFGLWFFAVNLPFYWLAWRHMGRAFTFKTFAAVALLSVLSEAMPQLMGFATLAPPFAALAGGVLVGVGFVVLFRHQASMGGVGVLAVLLQKRLGWRAGKVQMSIDVSIALAAFAVLPPSKVLLSVVGAVALNGVLAINHRPGRYVAR